MVAFTLFAEAMKKSQFYRKYLPESTFPQSFWQDSANKSYSVMFMSAALNIHSEHYGVPQR